MSVSGGVEFEEEIDDNIEEAVTAFTSSVKPLQKSPAPSYETPEPKSDSTAARSHGTPEPHTVSGTSSSSVQKTTIIKAVVEEPPGEEPPSPRQQEEVELEGDEESEESEWDSEVGFTYFWDLLTSGPGCSKLTTSLVNVLLKFQTLI